jgi:hypothetical protein
MAQLPNEQLWNDAQNAHERGDFDAEVVLRRELCNLFPGDTNCLHNLGLALLKQGNIDEAISTFERALATDPTASRAYNNLASALLQKGVDLQHLVPTFYAALLCSESYEDLIRHFINLCLSASLGSDQGNRELLDEIAQILPKVFEHCSGEPDAKREQLNQFFVILDAHRPLAVYREAFAAKRWAEAANSLETAKGRFQQCRFLQRVNFIDQRLVPLLGVCRDIFGFLERIASGQFASPIAARSACEYCRTEAARIRESFGSSGVHLAFFDAMGWFLTKLTKRLAALTTDGMIEDRDEVQSEIIGLLTAESFTGVGADLLSLLNAFDRQCLSLRNQLLNIASEPMRDSIRNDVWLKVALQCNSLAFDFRNVSGDMAKSMLGWNVDFRDQIRRTLEGFKSFVERQAASDILNGGQPSESIGRTLLQAYLTPRSYREVPVRGGKCDILAFTSGGKRVVLETKIWRGAEYYEQGLREIGEYLEGEATDCDYGGAFYVIFDPTKGDCASAHLGGWYTTQSTGRFAVDAIVIRIALQFLARSDEGAESPKLGFR